MLSPLVEKRYGKYERKPAQQRLPKKCGETGFTDEIDWVEWDRAIGVAKDLNKPIFFLIHKT
ncbi:hypothetical protein NECAME_18194, partial [Necator americanus]